MKAIVRFKIPVVHVVVALTRIKRRIDKTRGCDVKCSSFQLVSFSVMFVPSGDHMLRDAAFLSI